MTSRDNEVTVRSSHQMRAWFNAPRHFGLRAWSGAVLVLGGSSRDDGDVDVGVGGEGAELVHEAAGAAGGVGPLLVPARGRGGGPVLRGWGRGPDAGRGWGGRRPPRPLSRR